MRASTFNFFNPPDTKLRKLKVERVILALGIIRKGKLLTCLRVSRAAKSRHKKNVKCKPPATVCQPVEPVVQVWIVNGIVSFIFQFDAFSN